MGEQQSQPYQLAQLNVGRLRAPADAPEIAEFMAALPAVNALADAAPGFVWRLVADYAENATAIQAFDDKLIIINMSVWESLESLRDYVFATDHVSYLRRRREWFERMDEAYAVLWWVPAGYRPGIDDAVAKLRLLRAQGPGAEAFTFREPLPPPGAA